MSNPKFTVVIVGGSITGLALANMLQLNNIDFVLLEAYPEMAPQVGASLGLLPNGNRILDQLGLYEKVLALSAPVNHFNFRNAKGVLLAEHKNTAQDFVKR
jgi:2-polyprenyl-6-methoxyphenol hydroxylase-like FAD-dependent oxidoreductase